jgi:hypothetical protein
MPMRARARFTARLRVRTFRTLFRSQTGFAAIIPTDSVTAVGRPVVEIMTDARIAAVIGTGAAAAIGTVAAAAMVAVTAAVMVDERCGFCWSRMTSIFSAF